MFEIMPLVLLKISYLVTGLSLCIIGKNLIEKKIETKFEGEGSVAETSFKIITTSPGLIFLLAGFVVIGVAIFQQSEIKEAYRKGTSAEKDRKNIKLKTLRENNYQTLIEKTRTIRFAVGSGITQFVKTELKRAKELSVLGKVNEAAVHLSVAVVVQPDILGAIVSDPAYTSVLKQAQFNSIAHARFELPLHTTNMPIMSFSSMRDEVADRLQILSTREKFQDDQTLKARAIAGLLTSTRSTQSKEKIVANLLELLNKSPHVLLEYLSGTEGQWILEDPEILSRLEAGIDWKIQNE